MDSYLNKELFGQDLQDLSGWFYFFIAFLKKAMKLNRLRRILILIFHKITIIIFARLEFES